MCRFNHRLPNRFQCERTKPTGGRRAEQLADWLQRVDDALHLRGWHKVARVRVRLTVVGLRVLVVGVEDLRDGQLGCDRGDLPPVRKPQGYQAVIFRDGLGGPMLSEIGIVPIESHDGLPGRFVETVFRLLRFARH